MATTKPRRRSRKLLTCHICRDKSLAVRRGPDGKAICDQCIRAERIRAERKRG